MYDYFDLSLINIPHFDHKPVESVLYLAEKVMG